VARLKQLPFYIFQGLRDGGGRASLLAHAVLVAAGSQVAWLAIYMYPETSDRFGLVLPDVEEAMFRDSSTQTYESVMMNDWLLPEPPAWQTVERQALSSR
jgi:hypothetical protein